MVTSELHCLFRILLLEGIQYLVAKAMLNVENCRKSKTQTLFILKCGYEHTNKKVKKYFLNTKSEDN